MAFPLRHNVLTLFGSLPAGEIWQTSFKFAGDTVPFPVILDEVTELQGFVNDDSAGGAWSTKLTALFAPLNQANALLQGIRASAVNDSGRVTATADRSFSIGGTGVGAMPNQIAVVGSLLSATPGPTGRGRVYLPASGITITPSTGAMANPTTATVNTALAGLVDKIVATANAAGASGSYHVVVASSGGLSAAPANHIVTTVKVGSIPDTQRRRRNRMREIYSSAPA